MRADAHSCHTWRRLMSMPLPDLSLFLEGKPVLAKSDKNLSTAITLGCAFIDTVVRRNDGSDLIPDAADDRISAASV
jgi:hypothetical protein